MKNENNPQKALIALLIVFLILFAAGLGSRGITLYQITDAIFLSPVKKISADIRHIGQSILNTRAFFISKRMLLEKNKKLLEENKNLQDEIEILKGVELQNQRLKNILNLNLKQNYEFVVGNVLGITKMPFNFAIIDKGENAGIKQGDPAIIVDDAGIQKLIGVVYSVSFSTSKILLVIDPRFYVSVKDAYSGEIGIAQGNKDSLKMIFQLENPKIQPGDPMLTTSASDTYPQGILVGTVKSVKKVSSMRTVVTLNCSANLNNLFEIIIIRNE